MSTDLHTTLQLQRAAHTADRLIQHSMPYGGVGTHGMRMMSPPYRQRADKYLKFLLK